MKYNELCDTVKDFIDIITSACLAGSYRQYTTNKENFCISITAPKENNNYFELLYEQMYSDSSGKKMLFTNLSPRLINKDGTFELIIDGIFGEKVIELDIDKVRFTDMKVRTNFLRHLMSDMFKEVRPADLLNRVPTFEELVKNSEGKFKIIANKFIEK